MIQIWWTQAVHLHWFPVKCDEEALKAAQHLMLSKSRSFGGLWKFESLRVAKNPPEVNVDSEKMVVWKRQPLWNLGEFDFRNACWITGGVYILHFCPLFWIVIHGFVMLYGPFAASKQRRKVFQSSITPVMSEAGKTWVNGGWKPYRTLVILDKT